MVSQNRFQEMIDRCRFLRDSYYLSNLLAINLTARVYIAQKMLSLSLLCTFIHQLCDLSSLTALLHSITAVPRQLMLMYSQQQTEEQARVLASRMRNGTGAALLLHAEDAPTHHIDALQRFQKDFASYQRQRRDDEKSRRQSELQRKRLEQLERENKRWEMVENYQQKLKQREEYSVQNQNLGVKRTANSNGLAYNPITLEYDRNPEGDKLKRRDEDANIRRYVRAHNMDNKGNSKYNPLTGENRLGIQQIIPNELNQRYESKKYEHYENMRLKVPSSANDVRSSYNRYY